MKRKFLILALAVCLSASLLTGCGAAGQTPGDTQIEASVSGENAEASGTEESAGSSSASEELAGASESKAESTEATDVTLPTKDCAGNDIVIPENVEKIVSMAPSVTEVLIDLGYADKIVACDTYSGYSAFASALNAGIPQFDMMAPDNEQIIALAPDIVFTTGMSYAGGDDVYAAVRGAGVCVADIPSSTSISGIEEDLLFIGQAIGARDKVNELIARMDEFKKQVEGVAAGISEKKTVLYVMSVPTPDYPDCYTCGKGTFMDEVFTLVGTKNIAGDIDYAWPALSEEQIIAADPDVIIVGDTYTPDAVNAVLSISGWQNIKAIQNKAVYAIDGDSFNQPNQYVMNSAYEIATAIYPDAFSTLNKPFEKSISLGNER